MTKEQKVSFAQRLLTDETSGFSLSLVHKGTPRLYLSEEFEYEGSTRFMSTVELDLSNVFEQITEYAEKAVLAVSNGEYELRPFSEVKL